MAPDIQNIVVSIHIPKTGGSTFKTLLRAHCPGRVFFDYDQRPLSPSLRDVPKAAVYFWVRRRQIEQIAKDSEQAVFVHGHFFANKYRNVWPQAAVATWFRHPVERLASHYYFWQRSPDRNNAACRKLHAEQLDLLAFARIPEMQNVHARFLGTVAPEELAFAGITEHYERSLELLQKIYFAEEDLPIEIKKKNINPERRSRYPLDSEVRGQLERLNKLDMELFARGQQRFRELCSSHLDGPG